MTLQEAIKILHPDTTREALAGTEHDTRVAMVNEACLVACEAMEKRMPKKTLHMHKNYYCPNCKEDGWIIWDDAIPNEFDRFCGMCGQAIDWSGIGGEC